MSAILLDSSVIRSGLPFSCVRCHPRAQWRRVASAWALLGLHACLLLRSLSILLVLLLFLVIAI